MNASPIIKYTPENFSILLKLFENRIRGISSYNELDVDEKMIISEEKFKELTKLDKNYEATRNKRK
jgi:hypothetical protein